MHHFTLYTHPYSRGVNVVWMLKECGAQYDVKLIPFGKAMKSADYRAVNPMGKVPALKADGAVLTETAAIITFLAEQFPGKHLIPDAGSLARGEFYRWLCFAIHLEYAGLDKINRVPDTGERREAIGYGDFDTAFATLRGHLAKHDFIVGNRFSALDVYYTGLLNHFIRVMPKRGTPPVFEADEPVFAAYINRHTARPAFAETMAWAQQAAAELEKQA